MTDVLVAGGGPAGIAAAVAAARRGAGAALVERYGFLGGMATAGLVNPFMGWHAGAEPLVAGIFQEMLDLVPALLQPGDIIFDRGDLDHLHPALHAAHEGVGLVAVEVVAGDVAEDRRDLGQLSADPGRNLGRETGDPERAEAVDIKRNLVRDMLDREQQVDNSGRTRGTTSANGQGARVPDGARILDDRVFYGGLTP